MATIEDVYSLLAENGAIVKFTNDSQLAPLRSMLSEVLGKANASLNEGNKKTNKLHSDNYKKRDKQLLSIDKGLNNVEKAVKEQKGGMLGFLKSGNLWMNAGKMLLGAASMLIDYGKQYYGNLKKLSDAGVRISEGFDRAFGAYSAVANMSHENFAKLLIQNKRFVTRMNSVADSATSGSRLIAEMAAKLNGRFALDEEQTGTILEFFSEITNTMSRRKLTDNYLINQSEILGQTMKGLSAAVGMSIEQFKEKVKQDEQDLAERRIMRDSRTRGRYMLNKAAMGKDAALYLETGIPNEKVLNMMANPAQQAFFQNMMQANQKTNSENKEEMIKYAKVYESNMRLYVDSVRENFDKQNAAFLGLAGEWGQGQFGSMNFQDISPEMMAKAIDESDLENRTVDGINMLNRTVDVIKDLLVYKVMKDSGKSIAEGFKYATMGADSLRKFLLGKDAQKIDDSMKGAQAGIDTTKTARYKNKIDKNSGRDDAKTIASTLVDQSKKYLKYSLNNNESLDAYNEYANRNGLLYAVEDKDGKIHFYDKEWYNRQKPRQNELLAWKNFGKEKKFDKNGNAYYYDSLAGKKYSERQYKERLDRLESMVKYDRKHSYQSLINELADDVSMDNINKINKERKIVMTFDDETKQMFNEMAEANKQTATNTKKQAEGINEANNIQKSNAANSSYNNMVTPGPFAIPAY